MSVTKEERVLGSKNMASQKNILLQLFKEFQINVNIW